MEPISVLHLLNNFGDSSITRIIEKIISNLGKSNFIWHVGALSPTGDMLDNFIALNSRVAVFSNHLEENSTCHNIKSYISKHNIRIVHSHTPRTILKTSCSIGITSLVKHLTTKHILNYPADRNWGLIYAALDRLTFYLPSHLVAVSKNIHNEIIKYPGINANKVTLIQNAVDYDYFYQPCHRNDCRMELGVKANSILIGTSGRLEKVKRLDILFKSFSAILQEFPYARLAIIGDGSLKNNLKSFTEKLGISKAVIWTGFRKDMPRLLAAMDIYVQSSVNEGLSLSILEAMSAEKPVIVTNVGSAKEVVSSYKNGIIIPPYSAPEISEAVKYLIINPEKRLSLAKAARQHIVKEFGLTRMTEAYRQVYEKLAQQTQ